MLPRTAATAQIKDITGSLRWQNQDIQLCKSLILEDNDKLFTKQWTAYSLNDITQ